MPDCKNDNASVPATLSAADVASLLGIGRGAFAARRWQLIDTHGFPRPLPGLTQLRWSRALVMAWIDGNGAHVLGSAPTHIEISRAILEARIGGAA